VQKKSDFLLTVTHEIPQSEKGSQEKPCLNAFCLSTIYAVMKRLWFFLMTLFFLAAPQAAANPLAIESAYLVSSSDNIQLDEVASFPNDAFKPFHKDLRLGFVVNPVWIKLRIKPQPTTSAEASSVIGSDSAVVLRTGLLALDSIELYEQVDGEWVKQHRGDKVKQKYKSCQDDFHCFELRSDPKLPIDLYLKIQTTTITTVVLEAVTVRDLPALVANRMVTLVSTLAVATSLLVIGLLFFVIERSSLVATFCAYQISVVLLTLLSTGLVGRMFENTSPDLVNTLNQYLLSIRATFSVLLGYVLLQPYKLHAYYRKAMWLLAAMCLVSMYFVVNDEFSNASRLNIAIHVICFLVQIFGAATAENISKLLRWITLIGYVIFEIILVGSILTAFNLYPEISHSTPLFMQSLGDWRLNGGRVGIFLFAILIIQVFDRRRISNETLQEFKLEAAQSTAQRERLIERQSMIDMLTHELKNPLGTIRFAIASLKRNVSIDSESLQRVKRIDDSVERMNELIEHVALSNKIDRFDTNQVKESVDVAELIEVSIGDYDDIRIFSVEVESGLCIPTNRLMLSLILQNLISNAYKYHVPTDTVLIKAYVQNNTAVIEVSNTIELHKSPDPTKLFQAYYRHNNVQEQPGMGLGLSLSMSAAEKINAKIEFSQERNLVVFSLKVPL
jgi:signal transduction histidine kinase